MPTDNAAPGGNTAAWDRYAASYRTEAAWPVTAVHYGPDIPTEEELRLLGDLRGKRVLDLGCGGGENLVALARAGATVVGIDYSGEQLALARQLVAEHEVRVELRQGDLADLAWVRAESLDLVLSVRAFGYVEDLARVFRQAHRVLKPGAPLVFSVTHPAWALDGRSYFDRGPLRVQYGGVPFEVYRHTFSQLVTGLVRSSYRVDVVLEPEPAAGVPRSPAWKEAALRVPRTLVIRARKEGN